jgi:molecular chaperone IbpA
MSPLLTNLSSKEINIMASPYNGYPTKGPHEPWGAKTTTYNPNQAEITITSLFPQFNRWAIGFDPLLDTFKQVSTSVKTGGYPPYNIYKNEDTYVLELAVAGFSKDDITITVKELQLTVEGRLEASKEEPIHKGIAARDFKQDFVLAEYVVVKGAELKDGLLRITLEQELPAELQPKVIKIK